MIISVKFFRCYMIVTGFNLIGELLNYDLNTVGASPAI